jgi:hypothetical protein
MVWEITPQRLRHELPQSSVEIAYLSNMSISHRQQYLPLLCCGSFFSYLAFRMTRDSKIIRRCLSVFACRNLACVEQRREARVLFFRQRAEILKKQIGGGASNPAPSFGPFGVFGGGTSNPVSPNTPSFGVFGSGTSNPAPSFGVFGGGTSNPAPSFFYSTSDDEQF